MKADNGQQLSGQRTLHLCPGGGFSFRVRSPLALRHCKPCVLPRQGRGKTRVFYVIRSARAVGRSCILFSSSCFIDLAPNTLIVGRSGRIIIAVVALESLQRRRANRHYTVKKQSSCINTYVQVQEQNWPQQLR